MGTGPEQLNSGLSAYYVALSTGERRTGTVRVRWLLSLRARVLN